MYTFLWFDKEQWEIANAVATCIAAVATFAAVAVSLWLAQRPDHIRLKVTAQHLVLLSAGSPERPPYAVVTVTNVGRRPAKVTTIGWQAGRGKSAKHFVQSVVRDGMSNSLPTILEDGSEARWFFPLEEWLADWPECLGEDWERLLPQMRVSVCTSASKPVKSLLDAQLRQKIGGRCRHQVAPQGT
ncbi:UNVERIFIED_ORG: hypothetical protein ABIC54_002173 [Burkholderia sp. 1263]